MLGARLRSILWIELKLADDVLPELVEQAWAVDLKYGLERHLFETREHVKVVRQALDELEVHAEPEESPALQGLVKEHAQLVKRVDADSHDLLDLAHAEAAASTEHLELAAYDALVSLAEALGEHELGIELRRVMGQEEFALEQVQRATTKLLAEKVEAESH